MLKSMIFCRECLCFLFKVMICYSMNRYIVKSLCSSTNKHLFGYRSILFGNTASTVVGGKSTTIFSRRSYCNNHNNSNISNSNSNELTTTSNNNNDTSISIAQRFQDSLLPADISKQARINMRSPKVDKYIHQAYDEAHQAFDRGDYETALKKYYWIIGKLPYDTTAYLQRSLVYEAIGRFDDAIEDCNTVIKMSNQSDSLAEGHMIKGVNLMRKQKFNEAIASFDLSLGLVENEVVFGLKKKALTLANPDTIIVPRFDDDYQFYEYLSREMEGLVQIKLSNIHGRGLFATRDIGAEELVFETRSVVSTSSAQLKEDDQHCHNCHIAFKPVEIENEQEISKSREFNRLAQTITRMTRLPVGRIIPEGCTQCNTTLFCSPECKEDGIHKHNSLCSSNILTRAQLDKFERELTGLTQTERVGYTMLLKLMASQSVNGDPNQPLRQLELDDFVKRLSYAMPASETVQLSRKDNRVFKTLKDIFHTLTPEIFYRLKSIVTLNQTQMFTSKIKVHCTPAPMDELGYNFEFEDKVSKYINTIPLHLSFMNHSCDSNVFIASPVINDKQIRIVSKRPIKKGEEILISYIDGMQLTTENRQEMLGESYGFQCTCPLCRSNTTIPTLNKIQ
ncbi:SET domain-containing protein [Heterostelium album PN500]|uniref:SET domain-containing protein n=1 Tax=Heterostelium pallidum (strain ATCC 26659 / Pp 5 / PN500) TaxID=670386 RepID=D3B752_HETP5|nr:SET domain-containing protein [Heterostelium album PN500]EFA82595.1 SET domain-containing protein [Heterostelium album PN500]|eukprot:XP_020434712.1 SET domain-containing protein [Heterostelium album PN500]